MTVKCEGYLIAYSQIDSQCEKCREMAQCKECTNHKLLTAKLNGGKPMEALTKKQLSKFLKAAELKKEVAMINKKYGYECQLVKGMTIEEAKELILVTAFPPKPVLEDDFEVPDEDDDFDDFEDSDDPGDPAGDEVPEETTKEETADDDLDDLDDLDDNPDSDETEKVDLSDETVPTQDPGSADTPPDDMDPEEYDSLIGRISNMEKRLDDIYNILSDLKTGGKGKAKAAALSGSELADEGETLKAGMPYTEADLNKMNAKIIKKFCKALGINSFQKKVADLIPQILTYQDQNSK